MLNLCIHINYMLYFLTDGDNDSGVDESTQGNVSINQMKRHYFDNVPQ